MERYNVGPHRKQCVWMMAGHMIKDQDYSGFIPQAQVRNFMYFQLLSKFLSLFFLL